MNTWAKALLALCCVIVGCGIPAVADAYFPLDLVPAAPASGDAVTLRLQPN